MAKGGDAGRQNGADEQKERDDGHVPSPHQRERVALGSILKNYSVFSLVWVLPLYLVQGLARVVSLALSRRFEEASQVLAAWGWNVAHLPGTLRLRMRTQAARAVPDRSPPEETVCREAEDRIRTWTTEAGLGPSTDAVTVNIQAIPRP